MDPKIVNKLLENVPELKDFISYIKGEVLKLDSLSSIEEDKLTEVEIRARKRATEVLVSILYPLINTQETSGVSKSEYDVV